MVVGVEVGVAAASVGSGRSSGVAVVPEDLMFQLALWTR